MLNKFSHLVIKPLPAGIQCGSERATVVQLVPCLLLFPEEKGKKIVFKRSCIAWISLCISGKHPTESLLFHLIILQLVEDWLPRCTFYREISRRVLKYKWDDSLGTKTEFSFNRLTQWDIGEHRGPSSLRKTATLALNMGIFNSSSWSEPRSAQTAAEWCSELEACSAFIVLPRFVPASLSIYTQL